MLALFCIVDITQHFDVSFLTLSGSPVLISDLWFSVGGGDLPPLLSRDPD